VDADFIVSLVAFAIVAISGGSLFFLLSIRDKVGTLSKRMDAQTQRIARLSEWLEGQTKTKRKSKNDDSNAK